MSDAKRSAATGATNREEADYQLVGRGGSVAAANDASSTAGLRKILEREQSERRQAETNVDMMRAQIDMMRDMIQELKGEILQLRESRDVLATDNAGMAHEIEYLQGKQLRHATRVECERLEGTLRETLACIQERRAMIEREESAAAGENVEDRHLCVVCCSAEKSIVLLPCRHMCLCGPCSEHEGMTACPLCRRAIINRFSVFA